MEPNHKDFNEYLKKFAHVYRVKRCYDGVWEILCSGKNSVYLDSLTNQTLCFYFSGGKSARAKNILIRKLKNLGVWYELANEGDLELVIRFKEEDLPQFETLFKIRKRKRFTPEYKAILIERAKRLNLEQKNEGKQLNES